MKSATLAETAEYVEVKDLTEPSTEESSGNMTTPGWADFLNFPWLIKPATPSSNPEADAEVDDDAEEDDDDMRTWARSARKARRRWQDENPY